MPEERQYVEVQGKRYPLKTEAERAKQPEAPASSNQTGGSQVVDSTYNVSIPSPGSSRTVVLAMLISFGTYALAGDAAYARLSRLQGFLGGASQPTNAKTTKAEIPGGGQSGPTFSVFSPRSIFGWMGVTTFLLILSDFDATSELAKSFALLIMFTSLLTLGPDALANIGKLTSGVSQ